MRPIIITYFFATNRWRRHRHIAFKLHLARQSQTGVKLEFAQMALLFARGLAAALQNRHLAAPAHALPAADGRQVSSLVRQLLASEAEASNE